MKPLLLRLLAITVMALTQTAYLSAQNSLQALDDLVQQIKLQPDDTTLNAFLVQQNLLNLDPAGANDITTLGMDVDSLPFLVEGLQVEVQQVNLFGDKSEEYVLVIRSDSSCVLNVFFPQDGKMAKVPGKIGLNAGRELSYFEQGFQFDYEEIAAPDEFCIITETSWGYNRSFVKQVEILQIKPEAIVSAYSFDAESNSYSGSLLYSNNTTQTYSFTEEGNFPRELTLNRYSFDEENEVITDGGDILKGKTITTDGTISVIFKMQNGNLTVSDEIRDLSTITEEFNYTKDGGGREE